MAEIKQYTRQIMPRETVAMQNVSGAFGGGEGAMALGKAAGEVSDKLKEIQLKRDKLEYLNKFTAYQLRMSEMSQELATSDLPPDTDMQQLYAQKYQEASAEFEANIPDSMHESWMQDSSQLELKFVQSGMAEQVRRAAVRAEEDWKNLSTTTGNLVSRGLLTIDEARAQLQEASYSLPNMPSEDRRRYVETELDNIRGNEASRLLDGTAAGLSSFNSRMNNGEFNDLPNLGKYIAESKRIGESIRKENEANLKNIELLQSGLLDPTNSSHKKVLDKYYGQFEVEGVSLNDGIQNMDAGMANLAFEFVKKYNIVPDSMQSTLRGMMNGGSLEEKQFAYEFVGDIQGSGAYGFSENSKIMDNYNTYNGLVSAGYAAKDAINTVDVINSPDQVKRVELHRRKLSDGSVKVDAEKAIKDIFGSGLWNIAPKDISALAISDFERIFENEFLKSGNQDAALAVAQKIINNRYSQTEIMGNEQVMDYPPERYAGHPALSEKENRKWQTTRLKKDLKTLGYSEKLSGYELRSVFENEDAINQGELPRYYIIDKNNNDYVRDKDNDVLVYYFDPSEIDSQIKSNKEEAQMRNMVKTARKQYVRGAMIDPEKDRIDRFLINRFDNFMDVKEGFENIFRDGGVE